ncbi:hypothetical protein PINS_up009470 [Pythium insidiosum]|nr:hypothetical protein PINS_up009470 [Pythium insidiosum]
MEEVTLTLRVSFVSCLHDAQGDSHEATTRSLVLAWTQCLHAAFYGRSGGSGTNKFLELETALRAAFEPLAAAHGDTFWSVVVSVIVALAREPRDAAQAVVAVDRTTEATPKKKGKRAASSGRQPFAPLAFVVVSALHKVCEQDDVQRQRCRRQGKENALLQSFCHHAMDDPSSMDMKLLAEVLDLFRVTGISQEQFTAVTTRLLATKNHSALIKLVHSYRGAMSWDLVAIIAAMIASKDWGSAEIVARTLEDDDATKPLAQYIINEAITQQEFKRAHRVVCNFGLQAVFPDIEMLYNRDALTKLVEKQRWTLALSFVGSDSVLQTTLLHHMIAAGEYEHATYLARERLGITDFDADKMASTIEKPFDVHTSLDTLPVHGYLELPLNCGSDIVFCSTDTELQEVISHFQLDSEATDDFDKVVGLDVEWRPTSTKIANSTGVTSTAAVASILQVASDSRVFLIDLLHFHESRFLFDHVLTPLFESTTHLKVGFGFDSDLKVLHQTFPEQPVFRQISHFLELATLVQKTMGANVGNSLSNATARILGKPLDKRMQLSNWDDRPLSQSQMIYAALDAHCLVQIVKQIRRKIKLTSAMECEAIWGYSPGTVPPFGHRTQADGSELSVFIDVALPQFSHWITGSGSHDHLLVMASAAYLERISVNAITDIALHRKGARHGDVSVEHTGIGNSESTLPAHHEVESLERKFLADTMVVRVGRWLRTLGIDVILWDERTVEETVASLPRGFPAALDRKSLLLRRAATEQRIVVTRDKKLADRRDAGACFVVSSDDPFQQFAEIRAHFEITIDRDEMMTRCARCNAKQLELVDRAFVEQQTEDVVHPRVLETTTEFWHCVACHKIFWEGPKFNSAIEFVQALDVDRQ